MNYLPFISSVGQSPKPHGISVDARIKPKINPNRQDKNIPTTKLKNPAFCNDLSDIIVPNVMDITGPIKGDTNMAATIFGELFSTKPNAAKQLK